MGITRNGDTYRLESRLWLPRPIDEIWSFFSDPVNLNRITPSFLKFEIETALPIDLKVGALIDYRLKVHGLPLRWRTEITEWEPGSGFVDNQVDGPYRLWRHRHRFVEKGSGTECIDQVDYRLPFGAVGRLAHALMVRRDVEKIFRHRSKVLIEVFGRQACPPLLRAKVPDNTGSAAAHLGSAW